MRPQIVVNFDNFDYDNIIQYYNQKRPIGTPPIQKLNRFEGGFMIEKYNITSGSNENEKYSQVRWRLKHLFTPHGLPAFTEDEMKLLYSSFVYFHGNKNVHYIST